MTPCACCGAGKPANPWVTGLHIDGAGLIVGVAIKCAPPCNNNRVIPKDEATPEELDRGLMATKSSYAAAG